MLVSLVHFLLVVSIPIVGGWLLYSELKWSKYKDKSIGYGCLWALVIWIILGVDGEARLVGQAIDHFTIDGKFEKVQFVAPPSKGLETMASMLEWMGDANKKRCIPVLFKQEPRPFGHEVWNIIYYIPGKTDIKKNLDAIRFSTAREVPVMKAKLAFQ